MTDELPFSSAATSSKSSNVRKLFAPFSRLRYNNLEGKNAHVIRNVRYVVRTPNTPGTFSSDHTDQSLPDPFSEVSRRKAILGLSKELLIEEEEDVVFGQDENEARGNWSGRLDFLLSCLGYAVGLGNVWRFPYLCFKNGGGAFLIPYTIFLLLTGIPVFLFDLSLGQFTSQGPATCWEFAPLFTGIGYAMCFLSTIVGIYYNLIIGYSIYYLFASMRSTLPWSGCENSWNTMWCRNKVSILNCNSSGEVKQYNGTCYRGTEFLGLWDETRLTVVTGKYRVLPAEEYYLNEVLSDSRDINNFGLPQWKLVLCLMAAWVIVFLCLIKGIKSSGKVVYFTALFPYIVLIILFFRGVTLSNAGEGIKFYILPDFSRLQDATVWKDAAGQIFFSLSASWGGLISLASYNRFHNDALKDTFIVAFANCGTSVFAGFVIFSYIGHLAGAMNVKVESISKSGFGLAFVIYPEALNLLPASPFWAILFFFMLLTLGLDSQFAMIETVTTSISDKFPALRQRKVVVMAVLSVLLFLLGIPMTCNGGSHLLTIVDSYSGSWTILLIGFFECITIGWIYGRPWFGKFHRFSKDIELMVKRPIWPTWRILWQFISPSLILFIIVFNWVRYERTEYWDKRLFPVWADVLGWFISITAVILIVGTGIYKVYSEGETEPSIAKRLTNLTIPSYKWGPALPKHRKLMSSYLGETGDLENFYLDPEKRIKYHDVFKSPWPVPSAVNFKLPSKDETDAVVNLGDSVPAFGESNPGFTSDANPTDTL